MSMSLYATIPPMKQDVLHLFFGKQRARVLRLFIFNPADSFTLAQIAKRSGVSMSLTGKEVQYLERIGVVKRGTYSIQIAGQRRRVEGKQREQMWTLNQEYVYLRALSAFVHEVSPVPSEEIVAALKRVGKLSVVALSGVFVGDSSRPADLVVAADTLKEKRLERAVRELEPKIGRDIRYAAFTTDEFRYRLTIRDRLIRDTFDYPHVILIDRMQLF